MKHYENVLIIKPIGPVQILGTKNVQCLGDIMSEKLNSYEEKDKGNIEEEIDAGAKQIGADSWDGMPRYRAEDKWGICSTCINFQFCQTEFGKTFAKCYEYDLLLTHNDKITKCSKYSKVGEMGLRDMQAIAWIIDPGRRRIGF